MRWRPGGAIAVVTGASSGIGYALCELLLQQGATVIATARRQARLEKLSRHGAAFHPIAGDLTDPELRQRLVAAAQTAGRGAVDLLVNNAGSGAIGPFAAAPPSRLRSIMEVNFFAPAELTRSLIPALRRGRAPVICNVSSVLGHCAVPNKSEYCASKFALQGWSDALRAELAADRIQVTVVSPSTTRSEFFDALIDSQDGVSANQRRGWPPEKVAAAALAAIKSRRSEVVLSLGGKALVTGNRCCPAIVHRLMALYAGRRDAGVPS